MIRDNPGTICDVIATTTTEFSMQPMEREKFAPWE